MKITKRRKKREGEEEEQDKKRTTRRGGRSEGNRNQGPVKIIASKRQEVASAREREGGRKDPDSGTCGTAGQFAKRSALEDRGENKRRVEILTGSTPTWDN